MKIRCIIGLCVSLLFVVDANAANTSAAEPHGVIVLSKNFDFTKKTLGITAEYQQYYSQVKFQQMLTQELMAEGYSIVERLQVLKVVGDIAIDLSQTVKGSDRLVTAGKPEPAPSRGEEDKIKKELSRDDLKKIGQQLGIAYMVFFNMEPQYAHVRIVNLETAEVVASASLDVRDGGIDTVLNRVVARSFVKALAVATNVKRPVKRVYCNYYDAAGGVEKALEDIKRSEELLHEAVDKYGYVLYDKNERQ